MPRRTGKRLLFDWASLDQYDNTEYIGICLTQRQVMICKAALVPAYWSRRWLGFPGDESSLDYLDAMVSMIDSQLDGNDCPVCNMDFRDNPEDLCEVQYSKDSGETWITMFRKDVCASAPTISITTITESKETIINNYETYDGDILNVAPQWEYVDEDSDLALCWAIDRYVNWLMATSIAEKNANNDVKKLIDLLWEDANEEITKIMIAALAVANFKAAAAAALAWVTVEVITEYLEALAEAETNYFKDEDAIQAVKCWMWDSVRGETPQWDEWTHSLDEFPIDGLAEGAIVEVVRIMNANENIYINYMILVEDINSVSAGLPPCDCPPLVLINQLQGDLGTEMYGYRFCHSSEEVYANPGDTPVYAPGILEIEEEYYFGLSWDSGAVACNMRVVLPPNHIVTEVKVKIAAKRPLSPPIGDKNAGLWLGDPTDDDNYIGGHSWLSTSGVWMYHTMHVEDEAGIHETPDSHLYIHNSISSATGQVRVLWIQVTLIPYDP